jgi:hypothetical protein
MAVVKTTNLFSNNEQITSAKLNNIMVNSSFDSNAVVPGQGLQVTAGGQMQIGDGAVTPGKLSNSDFGDFTVSSGVATIDNNAITTAKISDSNVTTAKIADSNVTTAKIADSNVTTAKLANASITAAKLDGAQTGTAPIFGARAWVNFNGTGTIAIRNSGNVSSLSDNSIGNYSVNFATAMLDAGFSTVVTSGRDNSNNDLLQTIVQPGSGVGVQVLLSQTNTSTARDDSNVVCVSVFR